MARFGEGMSECYIPNLVIGILMKRLGITRLNLSENELKYCGIVVYSHEDFGSGQVAFSIKEQASLADLQPRILIQPESLPGSVAAEEKLLTPPAGPHAEEKK